VAAIALAFGVTAATAQNNPEPRRGDDQSQRTQTDQMQRNQASPTTGQSQNMPSEQRGDQSNQRGAQQGGQNQQGAQTPQQTAPAQGGTQGQSQQGTREPTPGQNQQGARTPQQTGPAQGGTQGQSQQGTREPAPGQNQQGAQTPQQTGPAQGGTQGQGQQGARQPAPGQNQQGAGTPQQGQSQQGAQAPRQGNQDSQAATRESKQPDASGRIELSEQQQTRVSGVIRQQKIEPVTNLNFTVSVGTAVPSSVRLTPLPREVVDVLPQYRDYSFFVAQREVVIVDPQSYKIVAFVPLAGGGTVGTASSRDTKESSPDTKESAGPPASPPKARATRTERKRVTTATEEEKPRFTGHDRKDIDRHRSVHTETDVTVGSSRPESVEVEELPPRVRRMPPPERRYRDVEPEDRGPVFPLFDIFR
jgi:hypothetical protein